MNFRLVTFALLAVCVQAGAQQAQPVVIKFSHVTTADSPKGKAADLFKKLVEERTKGLVKVEVYPNSTLYKDKEELEALQINAVQMLAPAPGKFGPMGIKEYEAFELPYLFKDMEAAQKVTQGPIGKRMLKMLEPKGVIGLAFWDNSFRQLTSNKPIRQPSDLKGQKIRIQSSKVFEAMYRNIGVLPQVMAFSEVYQAMQSGVVDGGDNALSNITSQKFYEVQKYLTITNSSYHGYVVVASKKFWDSLSPEIRSVLASAMQETTVQYARMAKEEDEASLAILKKHPGLLVHQPTPEEMSLWRLEFAKVIPLVEVRVGKALIQSIYQATGFDPTQP